jgi:hypothetical protein
VGVIQRRQQLRFAFESSQSVLVISEACRERLDRDITLELRVAGSIDLAHAAGAEFAGDFVNAELCAGLYSQRSATAANERTGDSV